MRIAHTTMRDASVAIPTTCEHTRPFPWNPDLQVQVAVCPLLVHTALASQFVHESVAARVTGA